MITNWDTGKLYKHKYNTDIAIQVLKQEQADNGDWKLLVMWYNIGTCHDPWCMGLTQDIVIHSTRLPEWSEYA